MGLDPEYYRKSKMLIRVLPSPPHLINKSEGQKLMKDIPTRFLGSVLTKDRVESAYRN